MSNKNGFQPLSIINTDDQEVGAIHTDDEDEDTKTKDSERKPMTLSALDALEYKYRTKLIKAEIESPIESKYNEKENAKDVGDSVLLYKLLDKDQIVAPKLFYDIELDEEDGFKYHPRLGDLEKREITYKYSESKRKKEILWFASAAIESKRKIFISFKIKRISAIDNIRETFRMRFHLYLNWVMTENEYREYLQMKYEFEPKWKPHLEFMNAVEIHKMETFEYPEFGKYKIEQFGDFFVDKEHEYCDESQFDPQLCHFIRTKLECDITFAEELELQSFPFDAQDLSCIIKGNFLNKQQYIFLPELRAPNFGSIDPRYSVLDEWDLVTALVEFADDESARGPRAKKRAYPTIIIRLKVKRKWRVYVINIVLLLCALCGLSLCAFYLNHEQLGERLGLLITLILTSVAFSIVIQDKLPNVAYLTFIDKYILASYLFLILVMIESVWVSSIDDDETRQSVDIFLFYIASVLWIIFMGIVFIFYAYKLRQKEERKLFYSSDEINEIVNKAAPRLVFDYKNCTRTGYKKRILSFMANIKMDQNLSQNEKEKSDKLWNKYDKELQRKLSEHHTKY